MASTRLSDVIVPELFLPSVRAAITEKSEFRAAGIIAQSDLFNAAAARGGSKTTLPSWNALAQDESDVGSDDPSVEGTAGKITQFEQDIAVHYRNKSWSAMDLTSQILGEDVPAEIAARVAEYWARDEKRMVIAMLKGILAGVAAANTNQLLHASAGNDGLNLDDIVDALQKMGDAKTRFAGGTLVMHSVQHAVLQKAEGNAFVPKSKTDIGFDTYAGYKLVVDDQMPYDPTGGVCTTALIAPGAFALGEAQARVPVEVDRKASSGNNSGEEILYNRRQFILHPAGYNYAGAARPANSVLDDSASWTLADALKNTGIVFINNDMVA